MTHEAEQATPTHHRPAAPGQTVLVTGFGSFPGVRINPTERLMLRVSQQLARTLTGPTARGGRLTVRYDLARLQFDALLADACPDAVLLLGLASRSRMVRVERHARGSDLPLTSTAALGPALAAVRRAGIRARISPSAGRYLCNAVYAAALEKAGGRPVLFVHVPWPRPRSGTVPARRVARWRPAEQALVAALTSIAVHMATGARCRRLAQRPLA